MQVHYGFDEAKGIKNPVVTVGSFDGVHIGHKVIINRINQIAAQIGGESVLITFHPHPRKVLYPDTHGKGLKFISSQKERIHLLSKAGLKHLIVVKFSLEFAKITSEQFIRSLLINTLGARAIVVGFNHHFGHNRQGDFTYLHNLSRELNFIVEEIPEQDVQNETVSSTTIRKAIKEGKIQRANAYLDHQYTIIGALGRGSRVFSEAGFPSLSVQIEELGKLIPACGLYAASIQWNGLYYRAMSIIWEKAADNTNKEDSKEVDIHIFDFDADFPKGDVTIYFHKGVIYSPLPSDSQALSKHLRDGMEAIQELIY